MLNQNLSEYQLLAKGYLEEVGFKSIQFDDKQSLIMSNTLIIDDYSYEIIVLIHSTFPLKYPKFYIKNENWFLKYPHIEKKIENTLGNGICLITEKDKRLYNNSNLLLHDQLKLLKNFISDILDKKLDKNEIFDEFESYWKGTSYQIYINPDYLITSKLYKGYTISSRFNSSYIVIDEKKRLDQFLQSSQLSFKENTFLYLDLGDKFINQIPQSYKDFFEIVKKSGYEKQIQRLEKNNNVHNVLIFSFKLPNGNTFFSGINIHYPMKGSRGYYHIFKNKVRFYTSLRGIKVERIHKNRVYQRGGNFMSQKISALNKKVAIVGCGSVGASLAYKLLKSGITNLLLIDPQTLSVQNIARHLLGQEYVSVNKAEGTKSFLDKQFIECNIKAIPHEVEQYIESLEDVDFIVTALGSDAPIIEEEILKRSTLNELPASLSVWLEANAYAGHAIFARDLERHDIGFIANELAILDKSFADSLEEQDAGCDSSYMPYTFIDADNHVNHFAKLITQYILGHNVEPILSSIGDISYLNDSNLTKEYKSNTIRTRSRLEKI